MVPAPRTAARRTSRGLALISDATVAAVAAVLMRALPLRCEIRCGPRERKRWQHTQGWRRGVKDRRASIYRRGGQYSILFGEAIHAAKLAQASSPSNCVELELALAESLRSSVVEKRVVETGAGRIGGAGSVVDGIEPRPIRGGEAHGARLATGVELAAGKGERFRAPWRQRGWR